MFPPGSYPYGAAQAAAAAAAAAAAQYGGHHQLGNNNNASGSAAVAAAAAAAPGGGVIHQHATDESMREFWQAQMIEVQGVGTNTEDFKNHQLPLARIKKVRMFLLLFFLSFDALSFLSFFLSFLFTHSPPFLSLLLPSIDHEVRRGRPDDLRRGPCPLRPRLRDLRARAHAPRLEACRGEQEADAAAE